MGVHDSGSLVIACEFCWRFCSKILLSRCRCAFMPMSVCACACCCFFLNYLLLFPLPWWAVNIAMSLKQMAPCWKTDVILHRTDHEYGCHISSWHPRPKSWLAASPLFETTPKNLSLEFWRAPSWLKMMLQRMHWRRRILCRKEPFTNNFL